MNIGDHVICINAEGLDPTDFEPCIPVKGGHYVIRDIIPPEPREPEPAVSLVGITGIMNVFGEETCFLASRFRRLEEMKEEARQRQSQQATA